jgi:hypothetical protein
MWLPAATQRFDALKQMFDDAKSTSEGLSSFYGEKTASWEELFGKFSTFLHSWVAADKKLKGKSLFVLFLISF